MNPVSIPKGPTCDETLEAVLDEIEKQGDVCIVLVKHKVTKTEVILTFDDAKCAEA